MQGPYDDFGDFEDAKRLQEIEMDYKFERNRADKISRPKIIEELEKVAEQKSYVEFSADDFNAIADISAGTVKNEFGFWINALKALRDYLKQKGIDLIPRKSRSQISVATDTDLFNEMERIYKNRGPHNCPPGFSRSSKNFTISYT